jgi:hypothetical protein
MGGASGGLTASLEGIYSTLVVLQERMMDCSWHILSDFTITHWLSKTFAIIHAGVLMILRYLGAYI